MPTGVIAVRTWRIRAFIDTNARVEKKIWLPSKTR